MALPFFLVTSLEPAAQLQTATALAPYHRPLSTGTREPDCDGILPMELLLHDFLCTHMNVSICELYMGSEVQWNLQRRVDPCFLRPIDCSRENLISR